MNKKCLALGLLASIMLLGGCKFDEKANTAAVIGVREVLTKCNDGIRVGEEIQREFADRQKELQKQEEAIRALQQDPGLADPKTGKREELRRLSQTFVDAGQKFRQDVANAEAVRYKPIVEKINKVLAEYAKSHGLLSVQDKNGFAYVDPSIDITAEIIKLVDQVK